MFWNVRATRHQVIRHAFQQEQHAIAARGAARPALGQRVQLFPYTGIAELQRDAPFGRFVEAGSAVEHRGLAGAVGPDQSGDVTAAGGERQVVDCEQSAEAHGQMLDLQDGAVGWTRCACRRPARALEARPAHARPSFASACSRCCSNLRTGSPCARCSLSNAEGRRVAIKPRGFQIMISTIAKPNSSMRYCVGSKSLPNKTLRKSSSRMISVPPIMMTAAIATPMRLPMPPSTTMATITADSMKVKLSGEMNPCRAAKNDPAKPANIAPMAKAVSLVLVVLMPSERQAISSSRKASHARPIGSRRSRTVMAAVIRARARIR